MADNDEDLREALNCAEQFLKRPREAVTKAGELDLLRGLVSLTAQALDEEPSTRKLVFGWEDLCEEVGRGNQDPETNRKWVRTSWERLERSRQAAVIESAVGFDYYPQFVKEQGSGGRGNRTGYYISPRPTKSFPGPINPAFHSPPSAHLSGAKEQVKIHRAELMLSSSGAATIRYAPDQFIPLNKLGMLFEGVTLEGRARLALFVAMALWVVATLAAGIASAVAVDFLVKSSALSLATFLFVVHEFWSLFGQPFWSVVINRITPAPDWMLRFSVPHAQLELRRVRRREDGAGWVRRLQAVAYTAECPYCNCEVTVGSGGLSFFGRIIGRCSESPREHVFSFDHITRTGYPLRHGSRT